MKPNFFAAGALRPRIVRFAYPFLSLLLIFLLLSLLGIALFLGWSHNRHPDFPAEKALFQGESLPLISDTFRVMCWNIGYGGLGAEMDFFFDGGDKVRTSFGQQQENEDGITALLKAMEATDFFLLQEVDSSARRSWGRNQKEWLASLYPHYHSSFAVNYAAAFVPLPLYEPMGAVTSGLMSLCRYQPSASIRYALPGRYAWPKRLFSLQRCLLLMRFPLAGGKELVLINVHNEAFDAGGMHRKAQLNFLRQLVLSEYAEGNYVIAGGDWNQNPPEWEAGMLQNGDRGEPILPPLDASGLEDWQWAFDASLPTNRFLDQAYQQGNTSTTLIDFFLLSPNIQLLEVQTFDLSFLHSDHHPVGVKVVMQP
jgi:endonuclease/exonuclease/phosphatase family metal-dependent hydrolase